MKVLRLPVTKKWFDMLLSGEKKEEYREIKMYWACRLQTGFPNTYGIDITQPDFKHFDFVQFKNGYGKSAPEVAFKLISIHIGTGRPEWGAIEDKNYYVITIGDKHPRVFFK